MAYIINQCNTLIAANNIMKASPIYTHLGLNSFKHNQINFSNDTLDWHLFNGGINNLIANVSLYKRRKLKLSCTCNNFHVIPINIMACLHCMVS